MNPKPITHPLALAFLTESAKSGLSDEADIAWDAWVNAGRPLYADPAPMPAPALGMRVWVTAPDIGGVGGTKCRNYDIHRIDPTVTSVSDYTNENDTIDLITDFRTGEVIWGRA